MNYRLIANLIGRILIVEAAFMLPALIISLHCGEHESAVAFVQSIILIIAVGAAMNFLIKPKRKGYYARDGFVTVGMAWIAVSAFGALPMWMSGAIPSYIDSFFETVSGFTTTGSTMSMRPIRLAISL